MRFAGWIVFGAALGFAAARVSDGPAGPVVAVAIAATLPFLAGWVRGGRGWRIDVERLVPAPPELVFAILDDPARASELDPRIVASEARDGRELVRVRIGRREVEVELADVERDPPHRLVQEVVALRSKGKPVPVGTQRATVTIEPAAEGSRVRVVLRGHAGSTAARVALGSSHGAEKRNLRKMLDRLAELSAQAAGAGARRP